MDCSLPACPWDFPGKNTGVGCQSLLQRMFPTQGSNLSLLCCRRVLYHWATREIQGLTSSIKWLREGSLNIQPPWPLWLIWDGPMAWGFPKWLSGKELACQCKRHKRCWLNPWFWEDSPRGGHGNHSSILTCEIPWIEEPVAYSNGVTKSQTWLKWLSTHGLNWASLRILLEFPGQRSERAVHDRELWGW